MSKWYYLAQDRNRNTTSRGTVDAENHDRATEAASRDARSKDVPFYRLVVGKKKDN